MTIPERSSERKDSFVDESFGDSDRRFLGERFVPFFVHFLEDEEEDVVWKREEGGRRLSELRDCRQSEEWVRLPLSSLQEIFTYLP